MSVPPDRRAFRPSRREILALGVGAFVVAAVPFAAGRRRRLVRRQVPLMGTIADLAVAHDDPARAHAALDAAIAELRFVDRTMSRYRADSDVGRANAARVGEATLVTSETREVLEASLAWAEGTDGAFDPCLGRASLAWEVTQRTTPPDASAIAPLAGRRLYRALDVGACGAGAVVRLADGLASIDLGGIAKGYGVDRAVDALRAQGIRDALVNVGGDLYAMGASEDGDAWTVGVRSAADPTRLAATLEARDEAVATSGDYERCFRYEGRTYHHLLDPRTAAPLATTVHSVSVVAATCMAADAGATAAFTMGPEAARGTIARLAPGGRVLGSA